MADFTLKKRQLFTFALEDDPETVYKMEPLAGFSYEEAKEMSKIDDMEDIVEKGRAIRAFILARVPELEDKGLADMEYLEIFNAYAMTEGERMGESKASRSSSPTTARR